MQRQGFGHGMLEPLDRQVFHGGVRIPAAETAIDLAFAIHEESDPRQVEIKIEDIQVDAAHVRQP
jgi:hypothetical protein